MLVVDICVVILIDVVVKIVDCNGNDKIGEDTCVIVDLESCLLDTIGLFDFDKEVISIKLDCVVVLIEVARVGYLPVVVITEVITVGKISVPVVITEVTMVGNISVVVVTTEVATVGNISLAGVITEVTMVGYSLVVVVIREVVTVEYFSVAVVVKKVDDK